MKIDDPRFLEIIAARNVRRGIRIHPAGMQYMVDWIFESVPSGGHALFIGVGHGHDALVALLGGWIDSAVGVDPYVETDGNGPEDYVQLLELREHLGLRDRFEVRREGIEEYLKNCAQLFDVVICGDVLHHIFVESGDLRTSATSSRIRDLFSQLGKAVHPGGHLVITEITPLGLRPIASRLGLDPARVTYDTKHTWSEWHGCVPPSVWKIEHVASYVPYALRAWRFLLAGRFGRVTVSDRYRMAYRRNADAGGEQGTSLF